MILNSQPGFRSVPPGQRRPLPGSSPDYRNDYPDFPSSQESLRRSPIRPLHHPGCLPPGARALPVESRAHILAFSRHRGIFRSDVVSNPLKARAGVPPPVGRPRGPAQGRDGRSAPCSSSTMSSGRLFLDRVARQHGPSPLHRHTQINMHSPQTQAKGDISTLLRGGHFYFALTRAAKSLTINMGRDRFILFRKRLQSLGGEPCGFVCLFWDGV